ncbi:hypothetical protein B0H11DRAFT_1938004 [Mycena galericulata]|nr:hypothetical protein B0H11DRAFT_1938004 [Mycena galericulata]
MSNLPPGTDPIVCSDESLSFLAPDLARQLEVSRYVFSGATAIFVWDILNNLHADYLLLFKFPIRWPVIAYFISRIASLVYVLGFTVFATYPVGGCATADLIFDCFYPIAVPATCMLFFLRVRAIYGGQRTVTACFALLWLAVLGACLTVPFGGGGVNIGATQFCLISELAPYTGAAAITPTVHDTAVFIAISYRLLANTHVRQRSRAAALKAFFSGGYLPSFSKSLFVDGQMYYILTADIGTAGRITVVSNLALSAMIYAPGVSPVYRSLPAIPNIALTSIMACRVYRHTRLGLLRESGSMSLAHGHSAERDSVPAHRSIPLQLVPPVEVQRGEEDADADAPFDVDKKGGIFIAISKSTTTVVHEPNLNIPRPTRSEVV